MDRVGDWDEKTEKRIISAKLTTLSEHKSGEHANLYLTFCSFDVSSIFSPTNFNTLWCRVVFSTVCIHFFVQSGIACLPDWLPGCFIVFLSVSCVYAKHFMYVCVCAFLVVLDVSLIHQKTHILFMNMLMWAGFYVYAPTILCTKHKASF